ncbi:Major Facilitator Superfamily protein [Labrenzia sp. THAF82]|uniref:MFS transporter n=1 Tax=Labrenzia sp. THAF82 TaxID=2587861 RepID=UPI001269811A|nr:MFS transporter [Labrenzia sp. THAF82]QFT33254.1 Major Facilitator Superfamily protein [Labrenzia sp. THAF82]
MLVRDRAFFASMFLTVLADQILLFLVPLVIFQITGNVAWSGLAFFFETLPRYLTFPVAGILCDRYSPIMLLRVSRVLRALVCLIGITGQLVFGGVWWLIALSAIVGVLTTQGLLALEMVLVGAFKDQRFEKVASYSQLASQMGVVLGPLTAAYLMVLWPWETVVILATGLFVLSDAVFRLWPGQLRMADPPAPLEKRHPVADLKHAFVLIWQLPDLLRAIFQAAGVNLIIGATLATAAAMMTGFFDRSEQEYAWLQVGGALATLAVLTLTAHVHFGLNTLGRTAYALICLGAVLTGLGAHPLAYALGFLLIAGFDKMFNIYVRTLRKEIIPPSEFGKTTGAIICLNNLSQPLAGLMVAVFASGDDARAVLLGLAAAMALIGLGTFRRSIKASH